jgi:hypothetical protein
MESSSFGEAGFAGEGFVARARDLGDKYIGSDLPGDLRS